MFLCFTSKKVYTRLLTEALSEHTQPSPPIIPTPGHVAIAQPKYWSLPIRRVGCASSPRPGTLL